MLGSQLVLMALHRRFLIGNEQDKKKFIGNTKNNVECS